MIRKEREPCQAIERFERAVEGTILVAMAVLVEWYGRLGYRVW